MTPDYILAIRAAYGQGRLLLPGVTGVVVRSDLEPGRRHVLLVRRSDTGRWTLPSGIVEPFEQPADSLRREIEEETRVRVVVEHLALLTTDPDVVYPNGDRAQYVAMTFRCRYRDGDAVVGDAESTAVGWWDVEQLPDLDALHTRRLAAGLADTQACAFDQGVVR